MSPEELIRAGGATVAFDTNAIIGFTKERRLVFGAFLTVCNDANRLRDEAVSPLNVSIVVPSLARMEALHDLRVDRGRKPFDAKMVKTVLVVNKVRVASFDEDAAIKASQVLHCWFDKDEAWQRAKRERCLEALRLPETDPPGEHGLASIDWAIAAQAEAEGWILVTADTHAEFRRVTHKITKARLRDLLNDLLRERGLDPS